MKKIEKIVSENLMDESFGLGTEACFCCLGLWTARITRSIKIVQNCSYDMRNFEVFSEKAINLKCSKR